MHTCPSIPPGGRGACGCEGGAGVGCVGSSSLSGPQLGHWAKPDLAGPAPSHFPKYPNPDHVYLSDVCVCMDLEFDMVCSLFAVERHRRAVLPELCVVCSSLMLSFVAICVCVRMWCMDV